METIGRYLEKLHAATYVVYATPLEIALAEGLSAIGRFDEAIARIDGAIGRVETRGDLCYLPEALRVRANLLQAMQYPRAGDAEESFARSLALSRRQGARAWELRTATDLAASWSRRGRAADARALLQPVFAQFEEGLDTPDLKAAENLLAALPWPPATPLREIGDRYVPVPKR